MDPKHSYRCMIQCCGSGSGRICIILPDPEWDRHPAYADPNPADPDRYHFQAKEKVDKLNFFPVKFQYAGQSNENYDTFELTLMSIVNWQCCD
jgi:hypothetical protein